MQPNPPASPLAGLRLGFAAGARKAIAATPGLIDATSEATPHLSVDGMTPHGPNLSHWPGNRTPSQWKADLSTAIGFRFARAAPDEQAAFLGDAQVVVNDHYDTDGFGALLAVLRPDVARAHEELLLAAAATGDFGTWISPRAFAIDRIVARLAAPESPVHGAFANLASDDERSLARYAWLLEHAAAVLDHPGGFAPLYADEAARVQGEIDAGLRGAIDRRRHPELDFAAVSSREPVHRMTLNSLAGAHRVLHLQAGRGGVRARYHDRTESWFELVTFQPLPRRDLRPLAARLRGLEPDHDGAAWSADPPTEPIPELYFGVPGAQAYGQITRELRPSRLTAERIHAEFLAFFAVPASTCP